MLKLILVIVAVICEAAAALGFTTRVNLEALGLALFFLATLV